MVLAERPDLLAGSGSARLPRIAGFRSLSLGRFVECEPLDLLTGYICDELEVFVVVQDSELEPTTRPF